MCTCVFRRPVFSEGFGSHGMVLKGCDIGEEGKYRKACNTTLGHANTTPPPKPCHTTTRLVTLPVDTLTHQPPPQPCHTISRLKTLMQTQQPPPESCLRCARVREMSESFENVGQSWLKWKRKGRTGQDLDPRCLRLPCFEVLVTTSLISKEHVRLPFSLIEHSLKLLSVWDRAASPPVLR